MKDKFSATELKTEEWLKKARDDELNANSILTHRDGTPNGVCFLSHQMGEKYFKAFLVSKKQWFPRIHSLDKLLELCNDLDDSFIELKEETLFLDTFYISTRYPADYPEFSWHDAEESFEAAQKIKEFITNKIPL